MKEALHDLLVVVLDDLLGAVAQALVKLRLLNVAQISTKGTIKHE